MSKPPSGRGRHSFVQFYPSDWMAGTARMNRMVESIYFQICCYTWDKAQPVPEAELLLMTSDLDPTDAQNAVNLLIATGQLERDPESGAVHSPRALAEAERSLAAWRAKSEGGKKSVPGKPKQSLEDSSIEPEPEPEPHKKKGANAPKKKARPKKSKPEKPVSDKPLTDADVERAIVDLNAKQMIPELWNEIAAKHGLSPIIKMTKGRQEALNARVKEHGVNAILDAIRTIPQSRFLLGKTGNGWKANFDWLLQSSSCAKLIEGTYHNEGRGKGSAWVDE